MESPVARTGRAFAVTGTRRRQGGAVPVSYARLLRNLSLLIMLPVVPFCERREKLERLFGRSAVFGDRIDEAVRRIVEEVRSGGDAAVLDCTERFDGVRPASLCVDVDRLAEAHARLDDTLRGILAEAADNIRRFHEKQLRASWFDTEEDGAGLGQRYVPIERAGVYVPGGTAAYPSSVLMNVIPAQVAGVEASVPCIAARAGRIAASACAGGGLYSRCRSRIRGGGWPRRSPCLPSGRRPRRTSTRS